MPRNVGTKERDGFVSCTIRFDNIKTLMTRLVFMTDGALLKELMDGDQLAVYSIITIISEAHERSINTELLLCMLTDVLAKTRS